MNERPLNDQQLRDIIQQRMNDHGPLVSLNDLDVSFISNMNGLFKHIDFRGNISDWDTSNVQSMRGMFENSSFNGDISRWNTSKVRTMTRMFEGSSFNGDISQWNVENVHDMARMFRKTAYGGNLSSWNPKECMSFLSMFDDSTFQGDLSRWVIRQEALVSEMLSQHFTGICPTFDIGVYEQWLNVFSFTLNEEQSIIQKPILMKLPVQRLHFAVILMCPTSYNGPADILTFVQNVQGQIDPFGLTLEERLSMLLSLYIQQPSSISESLTPQCTGGLESFDFSYDH